MLLNDFSLTKSHVGVMVNQLQKGYRKGWDRLNMSFTYDYRIRLTDDEFLHTKGFMVIGRKEYQDLVEELNTEDGQTLTDAIYQRVINQRGLKYQQDVAKQILELNGMPFNIEKGFIEADEYTTCEELAENYRSDKAMYIVLNGKSSMKVLFRGKSVLYQGSNGYKIVYEESFPVDEQGKVEKRLKDVCIEFMEEEAKKFNYDGVNAK